MGVYNCDRVGAEKMINLLINHTKKVSRETPAVYRHHKIYFYDGVPTEVMVYRSGVEFYFCVN